MRLQRLFTMLFACGFLAAGAAATEPPPVGLPPGSKDWQPPVSFTLTLRAQQDVNGWLSASRPILTIRCSRGQPAVYMETGVPLEVTPVDQQIVRLRLDGSNFRSEIWHEVSNWTISSRHPARLIGEMMRSRRLIVEFTPFASPPAQAEFAVDGLAAYSRPLTASCAAQWPADSTLQKDGK